jgi:hypothetical protein
MRKRVAGKRKRRRDDRYCHHGYANYVTRFYPDRTPVLDNRLQYIEVRDQGILKSGCERLVINRLQTSEVRGLCLGFDCELTFI